MVGHLGSFLERKVTDIFQTTKEKNDGEATFTVKQLKARGRDVEDWQFKVLPVDSWGRPEQLEAPVAVMKAKHTPEEIRGWLQDYQQEITEWPTTLTDIRKKIFIAKAGVKNNDELQACMTMATNRRFLIQQPREEWEEGQKKPRYYLNDEEIEVMPF